MWFCHYEALPCRPFRMEAYVWCPHAIWSIWQCNIFQVLMILSLRICFLLPVMSWYFHLPALELLETCGASNHPAANPRPQALISCHVGSLTGGEVSSLMGNLSAQMAQLVDTAIFCWETINNIILYTNKWCSVVSMLSLWRFELYAQET